MPKLTVSQGGVAAGAGRGQSAASARARGSAPARDIPPNLDTGVLFVGDGLAPGAHGPGAQPGAAPDALAPLHSMVGARMGPDNPAWSDDGLALLRSLQKRLIGHALELAPQERRACLDAIAVLEPAVGMRLRIMQMQMSELEGSHAE